MEGDFTGIDSVDLVTKSTEELRSLVQERREQREQARLKREKRFAQACTLSKTSIQIRKCRKRESCPNTCLRPGQI